MSQQKRSINGFDIFGECSKYDQTSYAFIKETLCFFSFPERTQCLFLSRIFLTKFSVCTHNRRRKCQVVSKGGRRSPFGSGSSNRREKRPVGMGFHRGTAFHLAHDFPQESLVCYTYCDRWREKGTIGAKIVMTIRAVQRLFGDSRTEDICNVA